ncbi:MAG: DUF445 family protein [Spirochaetia bacterium]|nr:DUF445 family protein [Spirochaetia bacterium]
MNAWKRWDRFLNVFSWVVLGAEIVYVGLRLVLPDGMFADIDSVMAWILPVLLAGAVGYITNWLALWYLFKPYEPHWGGRIQGIIPRQKNKMAVSLGDMVGKRLLNPDALVEEMKGEVLAFVNDPSRMTMLREGLQKYLLEHEGEIVEFVTPYVERQVFDVIDSAATDDTWGMIWDEGILPRIRNEKSRSFVVDRLVDALRENAGGIIEEVRHELRIFLHDKIEEHPVLRLFSKPLTDYVMTNFADYNSMKSKLDGWLLREETQEMLRGKLLEYADQLTVWMKGAEGRQIMGGVVRELKIRGKRFLGRYIRERMPDVIDRAFASEFLRDRIEHVALPRVGNRLVQLIGDNKQAILDKLRLEQRVTDAVNGMDVPTFHQTLNDFMAENFCAVQVLGFVIGSAVGAIQLLAKIR